jgi:hypothetical protein
VLGDDEVRFLVSLVVTKKDNRIAKTQGKSELLLVVL